MKRGKRYYDCELSNDGHCSMCVNELVFSPCRCYIGQKSWEEHTAMKRFLLIVLLIVMCLLLAACGERVRYHEASGSNKHIYITENINERG